MYFTHNIDLGAAIFEHFYHDFQNGRPILQIIELKKIINAIVFFI